MAREEEIAPTPRETLEAEMATELAALAGELRNKSVAEIEVYAFSLKRESEVLKAKMRTAQQVRGLIINRENLARELKVPVDHLSDADVARMLEIKRSAPRPGDVIATPGTAVLTAKGQGGDA